jgi:hypothetical protein
MFITNIFDLIMGILPEGLVLFLDSNYPFYA